MAEISVSVVKPSAKACEIALKHRLYVPGWTLKPALDLVVANKEVQKNTTVVLAYDDATPIGLAIAQYSTLAVFVRAAYRRNGLGSKMLAVMRKHLGDDSFYKLEASLGVDGSNMFWSANTVSYIVPPCHKRISQI